ncbi:Golgin sub A member 7 [Gryganskiella cystojenkinii]|nr:Golgin sub A member 7 [Gryganskiella cystojenkinii]
MNGSNGLNESKTYGPNSQASTPRQPKATTTAGLPLSPGETPKYYMNSYTARQLAASNQVATAGGSPVHGGPSEAPTGTPLYVVRVGRDHIEADEATRFECEQFPEEFLGRMTRAQFKSSVEGINACMEEAERPLLNCLDTFLDCLTAYTAKHCFGTHYQRAIKKMEEFIDQENRRLYHPARMHLRDPQKVGMIYVRTLSKFTCGFLMQTPTIRNGI